MFYRRIFLILFIVDNFFNHNFAVDYYIFCAYNSNAGKVLGVLSEDKKTLICPFRTLDGLGDQVASKIIEERNKQPFISIEDLQIRGKVSTTTIDKLRSLNVLNGLPETSQLSLF